MITLLKLFTLIIFVLILTRLKLNIALIIFLLIIATEFVFGIDFLKMKESIIKALKSKYTYELL
jgi:hypothetical protein